MDEFRKHLRVAWAVLKDAGNGWLAHRVPRMGAALSYYTVFSMGPLIVIAIALAGAVFGRDAAQNRLFEQLKDYIGSDAAAIVQEAVKGASHPNASRLATVLGGVTLVIGATGAFGELHDALNTIWGVTPKPNEGVRSFLRGRFFSFSMVLGTCFLLMVSLLTSATLTAVGKWFSGALPAGHHVWQVVNFVFSLVVTLLTFTLILKLVPTLKVRWLPSLAGGLLVTVLFSAGKFALGLYISKTKIASAYGAAGSLIVLLLWVYYSAQILYFGSELSRALTAATARPPDELHIPSS